MILQHHKQAPIDAAKLFYHTGPAPGEGVGCGQLENNRPPLVSFPITQKVKFIDRVAQYPPACSNLCGASWGVHTIPDNVSNEIVAALVKVGDLVFIDCLIFHAIEVLQG